MPLDLRSGTSYLRSTTSNNRSCAPQLRSGTFLLGSTTLHSLCLSIFLYACCFVKKISPSRSFCHLHLSTLAIKTKESASNARKPLVGGREPHLCSRPPGLAPMGIHHLLLSNLTTVRQPVSKELIKTTSLSSALAQHSSLF